MQTVRSLLLAIRGIAVTLFGEGNELFRESGPSANSPEYFSLEDGPEFKIFKNEEEIIEKNFHKLIWKKNLKQEENRDASFNLGKLEPLTALAARHVSESKKSKILDTEDYEWVEEGFQKYFHTMQAKWQVEVRDGTQINMKNTIVRNKQFSDPLKSIRLRDYEKLGDTRPNGEVAELDNSFLLEVVLYKYHPDITQVKGYCEGVRISHEEIVRRTQEAINRGATELCLMPPVITKGEWNPLKTTTEMVEPTIQVVAASGGIEFWDAMLVLKQLKAFLESEHQARGLPSQVYLSTKGIGGLGPDTVRRAATKIGIKLHPSK
tara:strand:- start:227 stop:1189 length:963 start_codon:yes stop_codon:yes gene_type:complete